MFENTKLEKGMYNITGKNFSQVLEENDPTENYGNSPLAKLDAYERQLKRFDIKISGENCDKVEKFFTTTESAVLFPEFVRRAIKNGMDDSFLDDIVAAQSFSESNYYSGCTISDDAEYAAVNQGDDFAATSITEGSDILTLEKFGRIINSSYEALRQQRLDLFGVMLRNTGRKIADKITESAINTLKANTEAIAASGSVITYEDITKLYGSFKNYRMNRIIVSPVNAAAILASQQMINTTSGGNTSSIILPFGAEMITSDSVDDKTIIGIDSEFALEAVRSSDVLLETDRLIARQFDRVVVSVCMGFRKIFAGAVKVMAIN